MRVWWALRFARALPSTLHEHSSRAASCSARGASLPLAFQLKKGPLFPTPLILLHLVALLSCILSMPVLANPRNRRARHQAPARRCLTRMRPDASLLCTVVLHLGQTCAHMLVVLRAALHRVVAQGCPSGRLCTDFTRTPSLAATTVPHVGHVACCRFSETFWVCVVCFRCCSTAAISRFTACTHSFVLDLRAK